MGEAAQLDKTGVRIKGRSTDRLIGEADVCGTVAVTGATQTASQAMLFAPLISPLQLLQSLAPEAISSPETAIFAAMLLAWTADKPTPRATRSPRMSTYACRNCQRLMPHSLAKKWAGHKRTSQAVATGRCRDHADMSDNFDNVLRFARSKG